MAAEHRVTALRSPTAAGYGKQLSPDDRVHERLTAALAIWDFRSVRPLGFAGTAARRFVIPERRHRTRPTGLTGRVSPIKRADLARFRGVRVAGIVERFGWPRDVRASRQ